MMIRSKKHTRPKPVALIMLEGWGIAPASDGNRLISAAPYFSHLVEHYPVAALSASGDSIGLSAGLFSNGEIGHTVIGSGRLFFDIRREIDGKISKDLFASGKEFNSLRELVKTNAAVHLVGLLSSSETEASLKHLENLISFLEKEAVNKIYLHCILDGRETKKNSGKKLVEEFNTFLSKHNSCQIVSLIGRLYGLDEKNNISRTAKAFQLFAQGEGNIFASTQEAFTQTYDKKIFDEEFPPVVIKNELVDSTTIKENDVVIFWNYSGQGSYQLADYVINNLSNIKLVTLTDYGLADKALVLFSKPELSDSLGKIFSDANLKQLRISESAGFPNITTAFDSYSSSFSEGVYKKLIPSFANIPLLENIVDTIKQTRQAFVEAVQKSVYDLVIVTLSQIDLMAHNQQRDSLSLAVKAFDDNIKLMIESIEASGGVAIIVGTHGFAEQTIDPAAGTEIFSHSSNLVPLYLVGKGFEGYNLGWPEAVGGDLNLLKPIGSLVDVAPTILSLANLPIPKAMVGQSLI